MTELANPATHNHPSFDRAQAALDAARRGDYGPTFEALADEVILENGPGAGPWRVLDQSGHLLAMYERGDDGRLRPAVVVPGPQ